VIGTVGIILVGAGYMDATRQVATRGPAHEARRETRSTLDPALFSGKVALAYQVAREIPGLLDQLHCYCECDTFMDHTSLLSCYTDYHAAT
jgi:hypothetical protein